MYKLPIRPSCLEDIIRLARKNNIQSVWLFGSRARGDFHRTSDIDLAVYGGDPTNYYLDLEEEADTLLMFDVVDLSILKNRRLKVECGTYPAIKIAVEDKILHYIL